MRVDEVELLAVTNDPSVRPLEMNRHWEDSPQGSVPGFVSARERGEQDLIASDLRQHGRVRAEQAHGTSHNHIEHRMDVRLRLTDDAQNVASCGLLVERRRQVMVARLELP